MVPEDTPADDDLQRWISDSAVRLRSADLRDDDLEFLVDVIGAASIVQLGEASHSVGNAFAAKARIAMFLHDRMGFDVLIWEGAPGLYGLRGPGGQSGSVDGNGTPGVRGGGTWEPWDELAPLWEYVRASRATSRPLEMSGYDVLTSPAAVERFERDLRSFVGAVGDDPGRDGLDTLADDTLAAYAAIASADVPTDEQVEELVRTADALSAGIDENREALDRAHGADEVTFFERSLESLRTDGTGKYHLSRDSSPRLDSPSFTRFWHERDVQGARNLRWLIDSEHAGRKVLIWAHNVHVANAYQGTGFAGTHAEDGEGRMTPIGVPVAATWGDRVYTIAVSHFDGEQGVAGTENVLEVRPAAPGSLEARLHELGSPAAFLDLRPLDPRVEHPMTGLQSLRLILMPDDDNDHGIADITRVVDGILHIDRATPASRRSTTEG